MCSKSYTEGEKTMNDNRAVSKNFLEAFWKKGNKPQAYNPKLSINFASFFDIILCKMTLYISKTTS